MANKWHPCPTLKSENVLGCFFHNAVSLQSPVFTSSRLNNDLGRKGQFSCLIVHVCLQESNRKDSDLV